ncbi:MULTISPECIES: DNA replication terminus site-binding protein [Modicisalibacter]|uniref:DNA replication terminus site-binding protein n=1 Tax=Modicisalibacter tunisiensis TaxID=390637 RepID=A0ABS7WZI3_9GAMM|nr:MULTISPECIES: DNA replication terminus site-binding protein [Modicisalibacter]MBZ9538540.1 DNA replication terminus site-binding protein [Modicisalibacter tunisiensis]MBZ9568047.1 DNA replication terminus site-binding protein [Modicisalibacter tunisiensis]
MEAQYRLMAELEVAFDALIDATHRLLDIYADAPREAWALETPTPDRDWLQGALFDFWYHDGQDGRVTRSYVGLIAADDALLDAVGEVNRRKSAFAATLAEIRDQAAGLIPEAKAVLPFRHPALHQHLRGQGLARLHLKQCWRHIPVADAPLSRVRLAWYSSGRSIKRLSVREAEQRLLTMDSEAPHIRIQLERLAGLPSSEPLAQVQKQAPVMRANLFFAEPLADGRERRAMNLPLPLFIPTPDARLPRHNTPLPRPPEGRTRARRSDERLEDDVFLPSLRVYRYRSR